MQEGAMFGSYRVLRKLGEGGMGIVFLGEHALIGRRAAIKVLHPERSEHRDKVERFFNEARATSAVSDPGIVQIYDFGVTPEGTAFIVMEYLEGEQLDHRMKRLGTLAPAEAVRIVRQIAGSLATAHAAGIVHRDLKPENMFMVREAEATGGERVKIVDFGIAKLGDHGGGDKFKTRTGAVMGTPVYMSPEQCNDTGTVDHRTDIYSLGCVLFHFLVGRPPFDVHGIAAVMAAHLREPPPRASHVAAQLPVMLDDIILRCMAKLPGERFASMLELQQACDAALPALANLRAVTVPAAMSTSMTTTASAAQHTTLGASAGQPSRELGMRRHAAWWIGGGTAAAAIVVGVVVAIASSGRHPTLAAAPPIPLPVPVAQPLAPPPPPPQPTTTPPVAAEVTPPDAPPPVEVDAAAPPAHHGQHGTAKHGTVKPPKPPAENVYDDR